jgi:hypothetical protein
LCALRALHVGEEVSLCYGALTNDELLADFGFTLDANPHDALEIYCDEALLNTARVVMGQQAPESVLSLRSVATWQRYWLQALQLIGPDADYAVQIGGKDIVGPKLWAMLRILYSASEHELAQHGYDPSSLQRIGSLGSARAEAQVLRTLVGMLAVILRGYGTELSKDLLQLQRGTAGMEESAQFAQLASADPVLIRTDCLHLLADILVDGAAIKQQPVVQELGLQLPINVREAYRYRIRKKQLLSQAIQRLAELHAMLRKNCADIPSLLDIFNSSSEEKPSRNAKIRELLDEQGKKSAKVDAVAAAGAICALYGRRGAGL